MRLFFCFISAFLALSNTTAQANVEVDDLSVQGTRCDLARDTRAVHLVSWLPSGDENGNVVVAITLGFYGCQQTQNGGQWVPIHPSSNEALLTINQLATPEMSRFVSRLSDAFPTMSLISMPLASMLTHAQLHDLEAGRTVSVTLNIFLGKSRTGAYSPDPQQYTLSKSRIELTFEMNKNSNGNVITSVR